MKKLIAACLALGLFSSFALADEVDGAKVFKKCAACHGKDASKVPPGGTRTNKELSEEEIVKALHGYRDGTEYGGKSKKTMQTQAKKLSDDEIKAVAKYIKTL